MVEARREKYRRAPHAGLSACRKAHFEGEEVNEHRGRGGKLRPSRRHGDGAKHVWVMTRFRMETGYAGGAPTGLSPIRCSVSLPIMRASRSRWKEDDFGLRRGIDDASISALQSAAGAGDVLARRAAPNRAAISRRRPADEESAITRRTLQWASGCSMSAMTCAGLSSCRRPASRAVHLRLARR